MTLVTFIVVGVVLAILFVAAMVAVLVLNKRDRSDSLGLPGPEAPQQYGRPPQQ